MLLVYLTVCALVQGVTAEHVRIIGVPGNGELIPVNITLWNDSMVSITGLPDPPQPFFSETSNLYDFNKLLEAVRVVEDKVCYIKLLKLDYKQMKGIIERANARYSKATTHVREQWNIPRKEIKAKDLLKTVGAMIAQFCSGYQVFWMEEGHDVINNFETQMRKRGIGVTASVSISVGDRTFSASGSLGGGGGSSQSSASSSSGTTGSSAETSSGC